MVQYIKITFRNVEPLMIANDSTSQSGQTDALSYVPGTSLRGCIIGELVREGIFEKYKRVLLGDQIAYLNAYPVIDGHDMIPSLKGYYEDKKDAGDQEKQIQNILLQDAEPGYKRSALGRFCYLDEGCICYTNVEMGNDMKINKGKHEQKKNVFRSEYIKPGYQFTGYVAVRDQEELVRQIGQGLENMKKEQTMMIGSSRSAGYGRCEILENTVTDQLPYGEYAQQEDLQGQAYMMLLSNTAMMNPCGEVVGIDVDILRQELGLEKLYVDRCSTSVLDVCGYNRTWRSKLPVTTMYEMGSVFKLCYEGILSAEKMQNMMEEGIGVRTSEGHGRVLFLRDYESIDRKRRITDAGDTVKNTEPLDEDEEKTLAIAAKGYYERLIERGRNGYLIDPEHDMKKMGLKNSQIGTVESILYANIYDGEKGFERLNAYLGARQEREEHRRIQRAMASQQRLAEYLGDIQRTSLVDILQLPAEVMGIPFEKLYDAKEIAREKQILIIEQVKRMNRGGVINE